MNISQSKINNRVPFLEIPRVEFISNIPNILRQLSQDIMTDIFRTDKALWPMKLDISGGSIDKGTLDLSAHPFNSRVSIFHALLATPFIVSHLPVGNDRKFF